MSLITLTKKAAYIGLPCLRYRVLGRQKIHFILIFNEGIRK
jgi:hypothetical protein